MTEVVSTIAACLAALFAAVATVSGLRAERARTSRGRAQAKSQHYQLLVLEAGRRALRSFEENVRVLVLEAVPNIATLREMDSAGERLTEVVSEILDEFNDQWFELKSTLMVGIDAWGDEAYRAMVLLDLQVAQDDLAPLLARLEDGGDEREVLDTLRKHVANLLAGLVENDPILE